MKIELLARSQKSKRRVFHSCINHLQSSSYSPGQLEPATASLGSRVLMSAASVATQQAQFVSDNFTKIIRCKIHLPAKQLA